MHRVTGDALVKLGRGEQSLSTTSLALFMAAGLALDLRPAPTCCMSRRAASAGPRGGVISALGIAAGSLFHIIGVASVLAALLAPCRSLTTWCNSRARLPDLAGARALRSRAVRRGQPLDRARACSIFARGGHQRAQSESGAVLPRVPAAVRGSVRRPVAPQIVFLGCLFNCSGTIVNVGVAYLAASAGRWIGTKGPGEKVVQVADGGILCLLGWG